MDTTRCLEMFDLAESIMEAVDLSVNTTVFYPDTWEWPRQFLTPKTTPIFGC